MPIGVSIGRIRRLAALRPIVNLVGKVRSRLCIDIGRDIERFLVGPHATAKAVVISSIAILILDATTAVLLAPYLQG